MELNLMPGFSLLVLVFAACASLTSVQSTRAGDSAGGSRAEPAASSGTSASGTCATGRRNCMNFQLSSMEGLNRQVNLELSAFYSYTAMSSHFASTDGAMRGTAAFFRAQATEEMGHANMFMDYIISRGGDLNLSDIRTPNVTSFNNVMQAMEHALEMEIHVTDSLLALYEIAESAGDRSMADFLDGNFIAEQVESMDQLAHYASILERFNGDPVGEYQFDEALYQDMRA